MKSHTKLSFVAFFLFFISKALEKRTCGSDEWQGSRLICKDHSEHMSIPRSWHKLRHREMSQHNLREPQTGTNEQGNRKAWHVAGQRLTNEEPVAAPVMASL